MATFRSIAERLTPRGLGAWLALAFCSLSIVLTMLLVEVVERAGTEEVENSIGGSLGELALQTADKLDLGMYERYREVGLMARRRDLLDPAISQDQRRRVLAGMRETYGYYEWIGLAGLDGKVLVEARGLLEGADVSQRPWFRNALRGIHVGDVHKALLLDKLLPAQEGEPRRFVDIAFPTVNAQGRPSGVLGAHLSWQWARDVERSVMGPAQTRGQIQALIVNREGVVLLGPQDLQGKSIKLASLARARQQHTGYLVERWPDGRSYLVGYGATKGRGGYPGLGWNVLVRQDVDDAYRPAQRLRARALWSGAALAILFSLAGVLVARRITRPLGALADSAERLRRGEIAALAPAGQGYTEVRQLSGALHALVEDLLRQRVEQRTRDLERALAAVRASEQRISAIVESAQDAFIAVDQQGLILDWNRAAEQMFGWRRHEAVGWPVAELVVPERYRASVDKALRAFQQSGQLELLGRRLERIVTDRQGREFTIEMTVGLAGEGENAFFCVFVHDISERKKIERMKNGIISTVSDALRAPLSAIHATLSRLDEDMEAGPAPDAARLIRSAGLSAVRLVRMVDNLLDIQKIELGQMQYRLSPQPLLPLAEQALASAQGQARHAGVELRLSGQQGAELVRAGIDRERMALALANLLSNAIAQTPAGKRVTLGLSQRPGQARLTVTDEGPGIAPESRAHVFERFAPADLPGSRPESGAGLGLSLSLAIVEAHGGTIAFETGMGKGTRFVVELPSA